MYSSIIPPTACGLLINSSYDLLNHLLFFNNYRTLKNVPEGEPCPANAVWPFLRKLGLNSNIKQQQYYNNLRLDCK